MEVVTGALPSVITKLAGLAAGEYNLQKGLKGEIKFLQEELESMKAALEDISRTPAEQLPNNDKIWSRNVRELSYDIEDSIDTFMVQCKDKGLGKQHGLKKVIDRSLHLLMQPKVRHKIAKEVREIKSRVMEVHERRRRYEVNLGVDKPVTVDPRLFTQYTEMKELVGIEEARDEFINNFLTQGNNVPMKQGKTVQFLDLEAWERQLLLMQSMKRLGHDSIALPLFRCPGILTWRNCSRICSINLPREIMQGSLLLMRSENSFRARGMKTLQYAH